MKKIVSSICIIVLMVLVSVMLTPASSPQAAPLKIRMGYVVPPVDWNIMLFQKTDILKHYGKSYTVEYIHFRGSSPQIQGLASGGIDMGTLAFSSFANAIMNAKLDIKIVADLFQDGVPGYFTVQWVVKTDSGINKIEDLKGKTIAINVFGAGVDGAMRAALAKHGLKYKRDYNVVEVAFPHQDAFLRAGKIDAACLPQPFHSISKRKGGIKTIFTSADGTGRNQFLVLVANTPFLKKHAAVMNDFWEDWLTATKWWLDPKNRDEAIDITAKFTKRPRKAYEAWYLTNKDFYHAPNGIPDLKALQRSVDLLHEVGINKGTFDVTKHADLSGIRAAGKRLGIK